MEGIILNLPISLVLIFFLGYTTHCFLKRLHIPGGAIIGTLLIVAVFSGLGITWAKFPSNTGLVFQIMIGIILGCRFTKDRLPLIKTLLLPGFIVGVWMVCIGLAAAMLLVKSTGLDLGTAIVGSMPGGISEMSLIALSYNLEVSIVTLLQFTRAITVLLITPFAADRNKLAKRRRLPKRLINIETEKDEMSTNSIFITLAVGGLGGAIGNTFGIPVGGMFGAMLAVAAFCVGGVSLKEIPKWMFIVVQIGLGGFFGTLFTPTMFVILKNLIVPITLFSVIIVLNGLVLGYLFHKWFNWDITTALLACAAAGYTQMSIIALEMDADAVTVSIIQSLRAIIIISFMPIIIKMFIM